MKMMQTKSNYLHNNLKYTVISKNDIDLRIGIKKINKLIKNHTKNDLSKTLLRVDSKRTIYFYNKDITGKQEPIDFLNEVDLNFDRYSVFINIDIQTECNDYQILNEKYKSLIEFFNNHKDLNLGLEVNTVEAIEDELLTIFVSL